MTITTIGVDLAKNSFQLHGVDHTGRTVLRKKLSRSRFLEFFADLPACTIGMEACGGAHHWARELTRLGHTVRLKGCGKRGWLCPVSRDSIALVGLAGSYRCVGRIGAARVYSAT